MSGATSSRARLRRGIATLLLVGVLAPGSLPGLAAAQQDTSAVAVNTKDGSSVFKLAFNIRKVMGDAVDQDNAAVAYASCNSCQTVAISIQVLLVMSDPSLVAPTNVAVAINQDCTLCDTLASAYQFVVGIGTAIKLTPEGRQTIERIRKELAELRKQGLSIEEIQRRTDTLMDELGRVLATEITTSKATDDADNANQSQGDGKASGSGDQSPGGSQGDSQGGPATTSTPTGTTTTPPETDSTQTPAPSQPPAAPGETTTPSGTSTTP